MEALRAGMVRGHHSCDFLHGNCPVHGNGNTLRRHLRADWWGNFALLVASLGLVAGNFLEATRKYFFARLRKNCTWAAALTANKKDSHPQTRHPQTLLAPLASQRKERAILTTENDLG
jgi:hypothetical protein